MLPANVARSEIINAMKEQRLLSSCFVDRYQSIGENDLSAFYLEVRESTFLEIIYNYSSSTWCHIPQDCDPHICQQSIQS